jgi:hypothetical protein
LTTVVVNTIVPIDSVVIEWIEKRNNQIDDNSTIKQNIAPQRHVAADPE